MRIASCICVPLEAPPFIVQVRREISSEEGRSWAGSVDTTGSRRSMIEQACRVRRYTRRMISPARLKLIKDFKMQARNTMHD